MPGEAAGLRRPGIRRERRRWRGAAWGLTAGWLATAPAGAEGVPVFVPSAPPPRPPAGQVVTAGESLPARLEASPAGATLILEAGLHAGPIRIVRPVTIWGGPEAIIRSSGVGTTIEVAADNVRLLGFSVVGSGSRFEETDAAVHVRGDDVVVEGLRIREALFGIAVSGANRVIVRGNEILGSGLPDFGLRGDAIRLWEVRDSAVEDNHVVDSRDIVVWYSPRNRLERNRVEGGRYGTHFMYSSHNLVRGNTYLRNLVGVFVMYCDEVDVIGNLIAASDPSEGMGLGLKEAGNVRARSNRLVRNPIGVFIDTSPIRRDHENVFSENRVEFCDTGVAFHSGEKQTRFENNTFRGCSYPVRVDGGGDALQVRWNENYFDDYAGFDLDGDGFGDVPYEPRSLSHQITSSREQFRFFRGTPALGLLDVVSRVFPILEPKLLLADPHPRMRGEPPAENHDES